MEPDRNKDGYSGKPLYKHGQIPYEKNHFGKPYQSDRQRKKEAGLVIIQLRFFKNKLCKNSMQSPDFVRIMK